MSNSIKEWFNSGLKMKRWLFLVVLGTVILSYGIANIIALERLEMIDIIITILLFTFGIYMHCYRFYIRTKKVNYKQLPNLTQD